MNKRAGLTHYEYHWHDMRRSWNRRAAEQGVPVAYCAAFLGHREEVNQLSYETELGIEFMRERMGGSAPSRPPSSSDAGRVLVEMPNLDQTNVD